MLFLLNVDNSNYFIPSDIFENVNYYIENSMVEKDSLQSIIQEKISQHSNSRLEKKVRDIYTKYNYDLTYSKESFAEDMLKALKEGDNDIVKIINVGNFLFYVQEVENILGDSEIKPFAIEKLKVYLDSVFKKENLYELKSFGNLDKIIEYDPALKAYIEEYETTTKEKKIATIENITELFQNPVKNRSWSNEPELLEMIDKEVYKQYMLESPEFLLDVMSFIRWTKGFSNGSGFEKAVDKIIEVMWDLVDDNNDIYSFKIEKLLKHLNITR